jgi:hypothetical protein
MATAAREKESKMAAAPPEEKLCSKCGVNPRWDAESTMPWCRQCWADYVRGNRAGELDRARRRGFLAGVAAAHAALVARFETWPFAQFSGREISIQIQVTPGPTPPDQT